MSKIIYILIAFLSMSFSAFAESAKWICITEQFATVSAKNGVTNSNHFSSNEKYILSKDGVKPFGEEYLIFNSCNLNQKGMPVWCERSDGWAGNFIMSNNNTFFKSGLSQTEQDGIIHFWEVGKCSQL